MNKLMVALSFCTCLMFPLKASPQAVLKNNVHTWESVGEVIEVTGKTVTLRQKLKLSEATWSLLPGAVAEAQAIDYWRPGPCQREHLTRRHL